LKWSVSLKKSSSYVVKLRHPSTFWSLLSDLQPLHS
jgi:hypothetical protein